MVVTDAALVSVTHRKVGRMENGKPREEKPQGTHGNGK